MNRSIVAIATMPLLFAMSCYAADKCELQKYGELPVTMSGTRPLVSGTINGAPAKFLADSGAFFSMLSRASAEKHQLRIGPMPPNIRVRGTGGAADTQLTEVDAFTLAGFNRGQMFKDVDFIVGRSDFFSDTDGIIGQNILGGGDAEYDLANGMIRLFKAKNCRGTMLAYWSKGAFVAEMDLDDRTPAKPHLIGKGTINGKRIRVMFDTGAWSSILEHGAAARAGIKPEDDGVIAAGISRGLGKKTTENSIARFDSLDLGGEAIKNARLRIGDLHINGADMLLGADFFLSHRVYVAAAQNKIYFTYNGGTVFDLRSNPYEAKPPTSAPKPATTLAEGATSPAPQDAALDASALRRRGAASAGRKDFDAAIADFDRAIALDANDPENFYERGQANWGRREPRRALDDFDAALKLKPDHIQARLFRGTIRLQMSDEAGSTADFQEALKLAPTDPSVGLQIAETYQYAGKFDTAIASLDTWIAAFPKNDRLGYALGSRCRLRAMSGKNLEEARADCDSALKKGPKNSDLFDSRGLVLLMQGHYDKAIDDYKDALELQPKKASSLYGLGLAETKKGLKDAGNTNIQAAIAINPAVATPFRRAGLAP